MDIRGRDFPIDGVSAWTVMKWTELQDLINETVELAKEYDEKSTEKPRKRQIQKELTETARSVYSLRLEIIKDILDFNDIAFDQKFWERKVTVNDLMVFLTSSIAGIVPADGKKKAVEK